VRPIDAKRLPFSFGRRRNFAIPDRLGAHASALPDSEARSTIMPEPDSTENACRNPENLRECSPGAFAFPNSVENVPVRSLG